MVLKPFILPTGETVTQILHAEVGEEQPARARLLSLKPARGADVPVPVPV